MIKTIFSLCYVTVFFSLNLTAQWSTDDLSSARWNIGIGSVKDQVFFAGSSPLIESQVIDIYDMGSETWTSATLAVNRQFTFAEGIGDKMYFAGYTQTAAPDQDLVEVYDSNTGEWSSIEMPGIFGATSVTSVDDLLILVKGGQVRMYNTITGTWSEGVLSKDRILANAVGCNGKIAFAGGGSFVGGLTDVVDIYDVATDTWSTKNMSAGKNGMEGVCLINKIYYVGGSLGFSGESFVIEIYDTETTDMFTMDMVQDKKDLGVAATDKNLYIIGGRDDENSDFLTEVEIINGTTGERTLDNISSARARISAFAVGNTVFAAGGFDEDSSAYITKIDIFKEVLSDVNDLALASYNVFPNPTNSYVNILKIGSTIAQESSYEIYNTVGRLVQSGIYITRIEMTDLQSGIYYIKLLGLNQDMIKVAKIN